MFDENLVNKGIFRLDVCVLFDFSGERLYAVKDVRLESFFTVRMNFLCLFQVFTVSEIPVDISLSKGGSTHCYKSV